MQLSIVPEIVKVIGIARNDRYFNVGYPQQRPVSFLMINDTMPATEQEYNDYIKSISKK